VKMVIIGNFDPSNTVSTYPNFPAAGTWYDYLTGETMNVTNTNMTINLAPHQFKILLHEDEFVWKTTTADDDWTNASNWDIAQVPNVTSYVTIPSNAANYPVIPPNTSVAEIHFQPGAQIGNQSNLTAGKAFVQYNLSNPGSTQMLSIPLGEVYPADFSFGGFPFTWVQTFTVAATGSIYLGSWVTAQNNKHAAFTWGDGFVLQIGNTIYEPTKGLGLLNGTLELPYFQNDAAQNINHAQNYDSGTRKSTFHFFDENGTINDASPHTPYAVDRTDQAYQLLKNSGIYPKDLTFSDGFALVGNPYMATLNFDDLYNENTGVIAPNCYIWEKNIGSYTVYSNIAGEYAGIIPANTVSTTANLISPLQGFLVEVPAGASSGANGTASLNFTESMATVNTAVQLRSTQSAGNRVRILAQNPVAGVRTLIAKMEGGQTEFGTLDAHKIMNGISDVPEIYTLKPSKSKSIATAINIVNNDDLLIPVCLATSYTGNITLTFSGMDTYDATLTLIDAVANKEVNLTNLASYDYTFNYTPTMVNGEPAACENRFFIRISKAPTGISEITADKVNVFESNGLIRIASGDSNLIKEVNVYDLQGALTYKATNVNAISHTLNLKRSTGVYIVKVISEKNTDTVKLMMR